MSEQSIKRRLVTGSIYAFGGQLISTIAALAGTALLARILSPHNLGIYFIAFSVVSLLSVASQFGLGRTVVRTVAEADGASDGGRKREVIRKSLLILAVSTGVLAILMYSGGVDLLADSVFHVPAMSELSGVLVLWFAMSALRCIVGESFRGLHDLRGATVFGDMTNRCVLLLLLMALWTCCKEASIRTVIALNVAALAITAGAGLFALHRKALPHGSATHFSVAMLVSAAWPVLLIDVANAARSQADVWLLGILADSQSVALYGAATRLALLIPMPLVVLSTVTAPYIASLHSSGRQRELQALLTRTTAFVTIIGAGAVLLYLVAGEQILRVVYGEAYARAYPVLAILAVGHLIAVWIGPSALTLTMTGHQKELLILTAVRSATVV
jgi:O-antigen/teichoic acid export membrane protein